MLSVLYLGWTLIWLVCTSSGLMLFFLAMERTCLTLTSVLSLATSMSFSTDSITRVKTTSSGGTRSSACPVTVISGGSIASWAKVANENTSNIASSRIDFFIQPHFNQWCSVLSLGMLFLFVRLAKRLELRKFDGVPRSSGDSFALNDVFDICYGETTGYVDSRLSLIVVPDSIRREHKINVEWTILDLYKVLAANDLRLQKGIK